jgi:hypothetical protein
LRATSEVDAVSAAGSKATGSGISSCSRECMKYADAGIDELV